MGGLGQNGRTFFVADSFRCNALNTRSPTPRSTVTFSFSVASAARHRYTRCAFSVALPLRVTVTHEGLNGSNKLGNGSKREKESSKKCCRISLG